MAVKSTSTDKPIHFGNKIKPFSLMTKLLEIKDDKAVLLEPKFLVGSFYKISKLLPEPSFRGIDCYIMKRESGNCRLFALKTME